jgi:hypothetical protein
MAQRSICRPTGGEAARISASEHRIGSKGLGIRRIQLGAKLVDGIID